jgi:DivIVA domain-containing protein
MPSVSPNATFRRCGRLRRGYSVAQVEEFFARARSAYEQSAPTGAPVPAQGGSATPSLTSRDVRQVGFDLVLGGFDVEQVDAALDRMEDAFARRESDLLRGRLGADRAMEHVMRQASTLESRLARGVGARFPRANGLSLAYDPDDVDELCERLAGYLRGGPAVGPEDLRRAVFRSRRGRSGYDEHQVDAFIDRAVEVLVAVD